MDKPPEKRGRGRPPLSDEGAVHLTLRLPKALIDKIDAYGARLPEQMTRSELVRRMLATYLSAVDDEEVEDEG